MRRRSDVSEGGRVVRLGLPGRRAADFFCVDFFAALRLAIGTNLDSGDLPLRMEAIQIAEKLYSLVVGANYTVKKLPDRQSLGMDWKMDVKLAVFFLSSGSLWQNNIPQVIY